MQWLNRTQWKVDIFIVSILLLLLLLTWIPVAAAESHETIQPGQVRGVAAGTAVVQAVPTEDPTVTALNKEKLQHENDWWWTYGATILTSIISTLTLAAAGIFTVVRYFNDRRDAREKQEAEANHLVEDRKTEREKLAEGRFQAAVEGLGSEREDAKVGAAITLRTFLRPGYEQFYNQTFDLAIAHLRLPRTSIQQPKASNISLPLSSLSQALITVFKESFPLARDWQKRDPQFLDATGAQLDNAYLVRADLASIWMQEASLRKATLNGAHLEGAHLEGVHLEDAYLEMAHLEGAYLDWADLKRVDLKRADLSKARLNEAILDEAYLYGANFSGVNLENVRSLEKTDLRGVKGLTTKQLQACKEKGAIIDEDTSSQSILPSLPHQSDNAPFRQIAPTQEKHPSPTDEEFPFVE